MQTSAKVLSNGRRMRKKVKRVNFSACYVDLIISYQYKYYLYTTTNMTKIIFFIDIIMSYSFIVNIIPSTTRILLTYQGKC